MYALKNHLEYRACSYVFTFMTMAVGIYQLYAYARVKDSEVGEKYFLAWMMYEKTSLLSTNL